MDFANPTCISADPMYQRRHLTTHIPTRALALTHPHVHTHSGRRGGGFGEEQRRDRFAAVAAALAAVASSPRRAGHTVRAGAAARTQGRWPDALTQQDFAAHLRTPYESYADPMQHQHSKHPLSCSSLSLTRVRRSLWRLMWWRKLARSFRRNRRHRHRRRRLTSRACCASMSSSKNSRWLDRRTHPARLISPVCQFNVSSPTLIARFPTRLSPHMHTHARASVRDAMVADVGDQSGEIVSPSYHHRRRLATHDPTTSHHCPHASQTASVEIKESTARHAAQKELSMDITKATQVGQ